MVVTLRTVRLRTLDDIRAFLDGSEVADITPHDRPGRLRVRWSARWCQVPLQHRSAEGREGLGQVSQVRAFLAKVVG